MKSRFIKAENKKCSFDEHVPAPMMRKSFNLDFVPENANICICGLGFYILYINGREITKGRLAPYISNPDHCCYYDEYDIAGYLRKGENVIGVILGNGFYNPFGGAIWDFEKAKWSGAPRLALEFSACGEGRELEFSADGTFKTHPSPIIFDELRMGEHYDAGREIEGWCAPGFDDSSWQPAAAAEPPRGEMRKCSAEPIRVIKKIKPTAIIKCKDGYIYDFGENNAGVCTLKINAEKGRRITIRHAELLKDGEIDQSSVGFNRPGFEYYHEYNQKDIYIAKGGGTEEYTPHFTYHGFRYAEVTGITEEEATEQLLTFNIMSSDLKTIGEFSCSDETVNKLFEMTVRSDRANFYYFPTDCPHREKNGWTGDASMSAAHMIYLYDTDKSWREWLFNIRKSQKEDGSIPGIVPTDEWGYEWGNGPAWDSVLFNLPYELFKRRGNTEVITENASAMMGYLEYIIKRRDPDGTIAVGLGDWVPVGKGSADYDAPLALTDSVMVMDMAKKAEEMFSAAGLCHQAEFARGIYRDMRDTLRRTMIDFEIMTVKGSCQSAQAIALYYGLFEECEKQAAFDRLMDFIHKKKDSFDCGFLGMHVIFHVLSEFGEDETAYHMITKKEYPSYAHWIEQGETTLLESFQPDGKGCGSHNHHFLGDIARWFITRLAGLTVTDPDSVEIRPVFIQELDYASARYELPKGEAEVSWQREANGVRLNVSCPDDIKCSVTVPSGYIMKDGLFVKK